MHSIILAGGRGTRLRPLTTTIPKPIVPLMNRPFAHYQINSLARAGISDVVLSLSYLPEVIQTVLGDGSDIGAKLQYAVEPIPLGTAGACRFAAAGFDGPVVVLNGDVFTDLDLTQMIRFHNENRSMATLALFPVADASAYGVVITDRSGRIVQFLEKPGPEAARKIGLTNINAGIYILEPEILDLIDDDQAVSFEYDTFARILELGLPFYGFIMQGNYWRDIGSPQSYLAAHMDCLAGAVKLPEDFLPLTSIRSEQAIIGKDCHLGKDVQILNCVVGPGTVVEEITYIENSVIWGNSRISARSHISSSLIGESCHIGRNVSLNNAILGNETVVADYSRSL